MKKWLGKIFSGENSNGLAALLKQLENSADFIHYKNQQNGMAYSVSYLSSLIEKKTLHKSILPALAHSKWSSLEELKEKLPIEEVIITKDCDMIKSKLLTGHMIVRLESDRESCLLVGSPLDNKRSISIPEVEFSVVGPKEAFVESLDTNLNLIRKRLPVPELMVREFKVGNITKTRVAVLYIDGVANEENISTVIQRIEDIEYDQVQDSSFIAQIISDNRLSPFPTLLDSERPDRVAATLAEGKVAILVNGSPHALIGPTTLVEFFSSFEDYFLNWYLASFFRVIRVGAVTFSILITPIYVAALNYHYELIPKDLLSTLITSRREIPLPPILEAMFLELTIELLREAGARLPTKVGQTIGIVGGIVIGTASVEAGLTSNVLLIIVALAALASFTTPVYKMGNTIRLVRFPFLLFAEMWGLLGIVFCFCFLITHLIRLTSLGRPFMEPIYPTRLSDMKDAIVRFPISKRSKRPVLLQTKDVKRFNPKDASAVKDIDE